MYPLVLHVLMCREARGISFPSAILHPAHLVTLLRYTNPPQIFSNVCTSVEIKSWNFIFRSRQ